MERIGPPVTRGFAVRGDDLRDRDGARTRARSRRREAQPCFPRHGTARPSSTGANEPPFGPRYPYSPSESRMAKTPAPRAEKTAIPPELWSVPGRAGRGRVRAPPHCRRPSTGRARYPAACHDDTLPGGPGNECGRDGGLEPRRSRAAEHRWAAGRRDLTVRRSRRSSCSAPSLVSAERSKPRPVRLQRDDGAAHRQHPRPRGARVADVGDGGAGERAGGDDRREDDGRRNDIPLLSAIRRP